MHLSQLDIPPDVNRISAAELRHLLAGVTAGAAHRIPLEGKRTEAAPDPDEHAEQVAFVLWLRAEGIRHNATPNGGKRAAKTAKRLKAEGVVSGFPDITIWPDIGTGLPVLYIEMKRGRGGRPTPEQMEWLSYLDGIPNTKTAVCHGAAEAIKFVKESWGENDDNNESRGSCQAWKH